MILQAYLIQILIFSKPEFLRLFIKILERPLFNGVPI